MCQRSRTTDARRGSGRHESDRRSVKSASKPHLAAVARHCAPARITLVKASKPTAIPNEGRCSEQRQTYTSSCITASISIMLVGTGAKGMGEAVMWLKGRLMGFITSGLLAYSERGDYQGSPARYARRDTGNREMAGARRRSVADEERAHTCSWHRWWNALPSMSCQMRQPGWPDCRQACMPCRFSCSTSLLCVLLVGERSSSACRRPLPCLWTSAAAQPKPQAAFRTQA
jgi:hypothetical protein